MKKTVLKVIVVLMIFVLSGCSSKGSNTLYEETQLKMGTVMTIKAYGENPESAVKSAFKKIDEIEKLTSVTIDTSDVSRINKLAGREFVKVNPEVLTIIKESIKYSEMSGGAFDITIGPIINLWGIGTEKARIPSPEEIKNVLPLIGYKGVKINEADSSVMLDKEGMIIDLGGIAKGYAADKAAEILKQNGVNKAILNLGGSSVTVIGEKSENTPWSIGLQHPRKNQNEGFLAIVREKDKAVSTSGDYERFFIENGKRYHHIINPYTGYPAESGIIANTIVLDSKIVKYSSMDGDALSTSVFILGPEKGIKLIESIKGVECVVATSDNRILFTPGAKKITDTISEDFKND